MGILTALIAHHVLPTGAYSSSDLGGGDYVPTSLAGGTVEVDADGDGMIVRVEGASVVVADVEASNGVIHGIDGVLVPMAMREEVLGLGGDGSEAEDGGEVTEETVSAEATVTTAVVASSLTLADVILPEDESEREELASDLEGAIASVVVQSLDDGDTLESVSVTSIGGVPVGASGSPQLLKRARAHDPRPAGGRLLRGGLMRSLQSAADVEFELVISRVCDGGNCRGGTARRRPTRPPPSAPRYSSPSRRACRARGRSSRRSGRAGAMHSNSRPSRPSRSTSRSK